MSRDPEKRRRREQDLVDRHQRNALDAADLAHEAMKAAREQLRSGAAKDPSTIARNAAVVLGISTDKQLVLEGRPTEITEHRDAASILGALSARFPGLIIDGTAEPINPIELPSGD